MNVKGTAVGSIPDFVKHHFPNRYGEWIVALSDESAHYFRGEIVTGAWYPIRETLIEPIKVISKLFLRATMKKRPGLWEVSAQNWHFPEFTGLL